MPRKDRVGSKIVFCDHDDNEHEGKIVRRKDNGDLIVLCLTGRNRGNSKKIKPDQIVQSSAAPEIQEMIESETSPEKIVTGITEAGVFKHKYTISMSEFQDVVSNLEKEFSNFKTEDQDGVIYGFMVGARDALFKYFIADGEMWSDHTLLELKNLTKDDA